MQNIKIFAKNILIPVIIGGIVGFLTSGANNYSTLIKPPFSPPAILFPIVWTILYTLMGISYGILENKGENDKKTNLIYFLQLFVNYAWSFIYFTFELRLFAFIWIILLGILVTIMIYEFYKKDKTAGLLQIPYLIWIIFASYLNFSTYLLNR